MKQRLHIRFNQFKNYFAQETKVGTPEQLTTASRIEVFYGLYGLDGPERNAQLSNLLDGHKFLYPNPSSVVPVFVSLISKEGKKRFFHCAILSSVRDLLFGTSKSLGFRPNATGKIMSQLIPEGVIAWICVVVCFCLSIIPLTAQIEWALCSYNPRGEWMRREFRPSEMEVRFQFYIRNMDVLNRVEFTEAVLKAKKPLTQDPDIMAPDDDSEDE